jgi:NDP-4-keto-2,6-dideoxyhexose 3-C-methyltransferase
MRRALEEIVVKGCEIALPKKGDIVIDIGANDGTLLRSYKIPGLKLVGFEPAKNLVQDASKGTTFVFNDFFGYDLFQREFPGQKAKLITSIAMFYDLDDPHTFVEDVVKILADDGVWIVQQNYLCSMLQQNGFDNVGHEHLTYYSLATMSKLLDPYGLEVFDVEENDVNGGSFRTYISRKEQFPVNESVERMKESERKLFSATPAIFSTFAKNVETIRSQLSDFVTEQSRNGKTVYVYGASTRGNTILQYCNLDYRLIKKATDANPEKWGRRTPGTLIPIVSKEEARRDKPDFFLVLPHHFLREIVRDEKQYLDSGGKLIVPLPKFRLVESSRGTN